MVDYLSKKGFEEWLTKISLYVYFSYIFAFPANMHLFKVNNRNTRESYEICSDLTIKPPERRYWGRSDVCIVNIEHISHFSLVFFLPVSFCSDFCWAAKYFVRIMKVFTPKTNSRKIDGNCLI